MTPRRFIFLALPPLIFLLLPCLLLWRVVFLGEAFVPADLLHDIAPWRSLTATNPIPWNPLMWDGVAEFYPWRLFAAESLKQGVIPLWNPHQFCGTPFVANSQSAVFYPLNLLFCLLPVPKAFGVSVLIHLFLTGLFAYLYLRRGTLRLSRAAALLGGICWQLCHWQVAWLALPTFLCVSTWLPLALLLVDRVTDRPTLLRASGLGICLGLILLAGHLQIALYCFGLITAYALFRLIPLLRAKLLPWPRILACAALTLALTFGFAAPQLLPTLELSRISHRAGGLPTWAAYSGLHGYTSLAMPPFHLATLFFPGFFGNPTFGTYWGATNYAENACYVGVLTLLLALAALRLTWKTSPATRFFAMAGMIALLMALGTPLDAVLFFAVPGFSQTGSPARILVLWSFAAAMLSAIGVDALLRCEPRRLFAEIGRSLAAFLILFALTLGGTLVWALQKVSLPDLLANEGDVWRLGTGIMFGSLAVVWLRQRGRLTPLAFVGLFAALTVIDLLGAGVGYNRSTMAKNIYPVTPLIAYLQHHADEGRVMPINQRWNLYEAPPVVLPPNGATVYGLDDTQGYDSLQTGRYFQFAGAMNSGPPTPQENGNMVFTNGFASSQAQEAAARYVVSLQPLVGQQLSLIMRDSGAYLYQNNRALPRLRITQGSGIIRLGTETPTHLTIEIKDASPTGTLILADQWYPGWQAAVTGRATKILAAPDVFRAVKWQPQDRSRQGEIQIKMHYLPTTFRVGWYLFCLAMAIVMALGVARAIAPRFSGGGGLSRW